MKKPRLREVICGRSYRRKVGSQDSNLSSLALKPVIAKYFIVRKMSRSMKTSVTGVPKSENPALGKGPKVPLSNTVKTKGKQQNKDISAYRIQRAWLSHLDKTMFQLLKHTICAAEHHVTYEILKKVSPLEAELVKDPCMKCKVRFRFSGEKFPPFIVFKIFLQTEGHGYKYFSGKNLKPSSEALHSYPLLSRRTFLNLVIHGQCLRKKILATGGQTFFKPLSQAVVDVCKIMGKKKFYHQIMEDERLFQKFKITDEIDIVTLKDYMQYSSLLDETPASSGGRNNYWRRLNLENIPRTMIMYDIVDYAETGIISNRLKKEMKYLLQRTKTEEIHQRQLQIVSEVRRPSCFSSLHPLYRPYQQQSQIKHLGRRSKQAQMKVEKMKKAYKMAKEKDASAGTEPQKDIPGPKVNHPLHPIF
uniref:Chromosome X open reading frame 58 n=1 Tax=Sus scrofa TaxID=9823 RepID=A0A5G2QFH2_PIG